MAPAQPSSDAVYKKVAWRLMPVLFVSYIFAYLDRVNIGFAKLGMKNELWYTDSVFSFGAGIFFIGYFLFEIPSNILMHKIGARVWIARIMVSWGLISALCAFSNSANSFYFLRFLLGIAEAGFFPAIILYLTYWFPQKRRASMYALFFIAINVAGIVGSPISGWIMSATQHSTTLKSWQWLLILEAVPSLLMGLCIPFLLTNQPEKATWLTNEEKSIISKDLEDDLQLNIGGNKKLYNVLDTLRSFKVWVFALVYFFIIIGLYGLSFWLPQIIENTITTNKLEIGFYASIPWACAALGMILYSRHSDRKGERRWHVAVACFVGMFAFIASGLEATSAFFILFSISIATTSLMCALSIFWSLPAMVLTGTAAAAGIALINSVGNIGGFFSAEMFTWFKMHFNLGVGLMAAGISLGLAGLITLIVVKK
jgi:sugar phosphate permease